MCIVQEDNSNIASKTVKLFPIILHNIYRCESSWCVTDYRNVLQKPLVYWSIWSLVYLL